MIVEALQRGLTEEPQLAITANLAPRLVPGGELMPERITIELCLLAPDDDGSGLSMLRGEHQVLHELLSLTAAEAPARAASPPRARVHVPPLPHNEPRIAALRTTLTAAESITLEPGESGLTQPLVLHGLGRLHGGETLECVYRTGPRPGFVCRRVVGS